MTINYDKPFVISYPHCSTNIPKEFKARLSITREELLQDMDLGTENFFKNINCKKHFASMHLWLCNLNRSLSGSNYTSMFPLNPSSNNINIYKKGQELSKEEQMDLINKYYWPYYMNLYKSIKNKNAEILIDVHSCDNLPKGNQLGDGPRADIILGNRGDINGNIKQGKYLTFDTDLMFFLKDLFEKEGFKVVLNNPFSGGNIIQQFGNIVRTEQKIPAFQLEINKKLYLKDNNIEIYKKDLQILNQKLENVIQKFAINVLKILCKNE